MATQSTTKQHKYVKPTICEKLNQLTVKHRLNINKTMVYIRHEYKNSEAKSLSNFVCLMEHDLLCNNNSIKQMLR
jgi:hypothetical protein